MSLPIRAGCILTIEKNYFSGSYRKPKHIGSAILVVEILRHSYGADKGQHTFTCKVLEVQRKCETCHDVGDEFRMKGRNLYPSVINHVQGSESKDFLKQELENAINNGGYSE